MYEDPIDPRESQEPPIVAETDGPCTDEIASTAATTVATAAATGGRRPSRLYLCATALLLVCTLLGAGVGATVALLLTGRTGTGSTTLLEGSHRRIELQLEQVETGTLMSAAEIYATQVNSTVGITTSITTNYFGYRTTSAASGSGVILTADGYLVTNYHVIEDADSIRVTTYDDTVYEATLIGSDEENDIAVLKIDATGLSPVILGSSSVLNVGDGVVAIGNPLGELTFSLTTGAVSALNREVTLSTGVTMDLIQTDCAINSGNSGGALFNMYGELVGITNAKYSSSSSSSSASIDNIGFAIPIDSVRSLLTDLIEQGYIEKPYIGVSVADLGQEAKRYGLPEGAAVRAVTDGSPADAAGLQVNDIITAVDGTAIGDSAALQSAIRRCEIGDTLTLTVYRQGTTLTLTVTVGAQRSGAAASTTTPPTSNGSL